jgi:ABC-type transport system involved in cytochrome bd biosynthesis fused ATPase/permease subunit
MQSKVAFVCFKLKRICLAVILGCMIVSIIMGKSIAHEAIFLAYVILLAFFTAFICICTEGVMDLWQNVKSYKNRKKELLFTVKNTSFSFFFNDLTAIIKELAGETRKLLKSDKKDERLRGYIVCAVILITFSALILSLIFM